MMGYWEYTTSDFTKFDISTCIPTRLTLLKITNFSSQSMHQIAQINNIYDWLGYSSFDQADISS